MIYVAEAFDFLNPVFCTDEEGNVLCFDSCEEAEQFAEENCQRGFVVCI